MNDRLVMLLRFGFVGGLNTGVDLAIFALLTTQGISALPAQVIAYSCGVLNSYVWNKNWTFRSARKRDNRTIIRFLLINLIALTAATALLKGLYGGSGLSLLVCKLIATAASLIINYAGSRYWVFGSQEKIRDSDHGIHTKFDE
jgi:putative flippase GtrA